MFRAIRNLVCSCCVTEDEVVGTTTNMGVKAPQLMEIKSDEKLTLEKLEKSRTGSSEEYESYDSYDSTEVTEPTPEETEEARERVLSDSSFKELPTFLEESQTLIAKGGFGTVMKVALEDETFALKSEHISNYYAVSREADVLVHLSHPNIIRLEGAFYNETHLFLKFPLRKRSLNGFVAEEEVLKSIFIQIVDALRYLHLTMTVIHRDLKPDNIMLDDKNRPELIDFGAATYMGQKERTFTYVGTPRYMAPEVKARGENGYTRSIDCYSFGATINELLWKKPKAEFKAEYEDSETRPKLRDFARMLR